MTNDEKRDVIDERICNTDDKGLALITTLFAQVIDMRIELRSMLVNLDKEDVDTLYNRIKDITN